MPDLVAFNAHNDYLNLAVVFGLPFAVLVIGWVLFSFVRTAVELMRHRSIHSSLHAIALGAWLGIFCALGHEVVDYGLKQSRIC